MDVAATDGTPGLPLYLFIAGANPSSVTARANMQLALERFATGHFAFEVVNVFEFPERALNNRVLVTPTLVAPSCARRLIGDLSEASQLHYFLQTLPR
jgi:circadian clock protein KaiB